MTDPLRDDPKVVCLVGSTKPQWKEQYRKVEEQLTHEGFVVISVVWFRDDLPNPVACEGKSCQSFEQHRELLERIHYKKIRISDAVVLIHPEAKGQHTQQELEYAMTLRKPVVVFMDIDQCVGQLISRIQEACDHKKPDGSSAFETDMMDHERLYGFLICMKCGSVVHV
jgi:nucleoside 2-deoxyribosyltransferase